MLCGADSNLLSVTIDEYDWPILWYGFAYPPNSTTIGLKNTWRTRMMPIAFLGDVIDAIVHTRCTRSKVADLCYRPIIISWKSARTVETGAKTIYPEGLSFGRIREKHVNIPQWACRGYFVNMNFSLTPSLLPRVVS